MKTVLFLTNIPSPYKVDFFNMLGESCNLTVLYERSNAKDRVDEWLKVRATTFIPIYLKGIPVSNDLSFCPTVIKYLKKKIYDCIIVGAYSSPTGLLAITYMNIKKNPYVIHVDGGLIKEDNLFKYKVKKHFLSHAVAYMSSGTEADKYLKYYGAGFNDIFHYPFTSICRGDIEKKVLDKEDKKRLRKQLGKGQYLNEEAIIVSVGQIIPRKGYDVLIKAARNLPASIGIYIIGGKATEELQRMIDDYHLTNVHFVPFMQFSTLKKYLVCADLFVFPTRLDIWGLVINEAMAAGLPIITTDKCVAGLELIKDGVNGYIVPTEDEHALSEKIQVILNNHELANKMGQTNLKEIEEYTIENMTQVYMRNIEEITQNKLQKV